MSAPFPLWIEPMAATLTRERFEAPGWVFEKKLDGIRLLAFKHDDQVRLLSRNQLPQNERYPELVSAIAALPLCQIVLDGEALGVWRAHEARGYHVFDVLWHEGRDLRSLSLDQRRALLEALPLSPPMWRVERLDEPRPWERACREGWEGVIAKRRDSSYESRRSRSWLKMKCDASQELVVGGFTEPQGKRVGIGALLVGYFEGEELVFAGKVGSGLDTQLALSLRARLTARERSTPPFTRAHALPRLGVHWVEPELVVALAFMEWTEHDKLRHPRLVGVREDKLARDVRRELP